VAYIEVGDLDIGVGNSYVLKDSDGAVCVVRVTSVISDMGGILRVEPTVTFEYLVGMIHNGLFDDMEGVGSLLAEEFAAQVVRDF
jgi:hypothetical protein